MRCSGDEAAAALSAVQFIAWTNVKAYAFLQRLLKPSFSKNKITRVLFTTCFIPLISAMVPVSLATLLDLMRNRQVGFPEIFSVRHSLNIAIFLDIAIFLISTPLSVVFVVGVLGSLSIFIAQAATTRAFGWTSSAAGFLVELAIEPIPIGTHTLVHIDWNFAGEKLDGIVHSWTYAHPSQSVDCKIGFGLR